MADGSRFCAACGTANKLKPHAAETPSTATVAAHQDAARKESPSEGGVPIDGDSNRSVSRVWLIGGTAVALVLLLVVVVSLSGRDPSNTTRDGSSSDAAGAAATETVTFSMRPVLGEFAVSPALSDPTGDHPPSVDSETGITMTDDVTAEAYLKDSQTGVIYWVGPAFVTGSDISGGEAVLTSEQWTVVPEFTDEGGERFREATAYLASYPVGVPQRQLAIVVDGVVLGAPAVAAEVSATEGLDPNDVVITMTTRENAESLALAFRNGS